MIQDFVDRFMAAQEELTKKYTDKHPTSYEAIVKDVVTILSSSEDVVELDPDRITTINHGDWQGTLLFIVGAKGYQPSRYYSIYVNYGSCSSCDTFMAISFAIGDMRQQVKDYVQLALHMVQSIKEV